jgi:uncharacterized membrane protein YphA (DoxX/SURF4 family)
MRSSRKGRLKALYWIVTLLFVVPHAWSALQYLTDAPRMSSTLAELGYPPYFQHVLGVAKVLGVLAIVSGISPTLKEWAYAGFTFDVLGALVSHVSVKDPLSVVLIPALFLIVQFASYALWRRFEAQHAIRRRRYLLGERVRELAESGA